MELVPLSLDGLIELRPRRFSDERGFFSEVWSKARLAEHDIKVDFVQDNYSLSRERGVLRGLHLQTPPFAQDKLVSVLQGSTFDVAVDVRVGSPTFGQWVGLELSAERWNQLLVPRGFAHGFITLEADTAVAYKVSAPHTPGCERVIAYDDPTIGISWPIGEESPILSQKDRHAQPLCKVDTGFVYGERA